MNRNIVTYFAAIRPTFMLFSQRSELIQTELYGQWSFGFSGQLPSLLHISICVASCCESRAFGIFRICKTNQRHLVFRFSALQTTYIILNVSLAYFPTLNQNITQTISFFMCAILYVLQYRKFTNTQLYNTRHYALITRATARTKQELTQIVLSLYL